MIALVLIVLAFAILWAIFPPIAVGIILVVGGGWLLVAGLCHAAAAGDAIRRRPLGTEEDNVIDLHSVRQPSKED